MPIYDFYCECGNETLDIICKVDEGLVCNQCLKPMKKKCNCHSFKLLYDNKKDVCAWGNEGYASSMYWSEVKKQRAEGKKVKGCTEV